MSDMAFTWRGQSSDDYGIVVTALPPIMIPGKRTETVAVPGRSGALHVQDGAWDEQLITIDCYLPYGQAGAGVATIAEIAVWLQGEDYLTLSDQPDIMYKARIFDAITLTPWVAGYLDRICSIPFWCDPFRYLTDNPLLAATNGGPITNPGTIASDPTIIVVGSGDVTLTVGGEIFYLDDIDGTVIINSADKLCYNEDATINLCYKLTNPDGHWPSLPAGGSQISWTGSVTSVTYTGNWRNI